MKIRVPTGNNYPPAGGVSATELDWAQYETYVFGSLQRLLPDARVTQNVKVPGIKTGRTRQVDVLLERELGTFTLKVAVDCKCYGRKVNVNDVDRFLGMLGDIRVSKGVLMTTKGYSKTAYERAENESRDVELRILTVEQLSEFHNIGCAVAWNGPVAAMVSAPKTWVIDNERRFLQGCVDPSALPQFTMYPLGHTRDSALARGAFIYGKIILKSPDFPTVEAVAVSDEERVLKEVPSAKFEWLEPLERQTHLGNELEKTILRIGRIHSGYKGPEYSLYIDHPEGVLLLVLFCPEGDDDLYVPSLKWIGRKAIMMNCTDTRQSCGSVP